ncbi:hypothetical protein PoB_004971000 [Plakobranchus ocellatus]|uniref:SH3 domain-containing protein n=1 Tax=Plakobranchus ocellatus TaxID=259542 RepID=A0AAV4BVR2_9GAST|nr:hypothetical protein PoB_004971000 [Plakobranchus ocellatus]
MDNQTLGALVTQRPEYPFRNLQGFFCHVFEFEPSTPLPDRGLKAGDHLIIDRLFSQEEIHIARSSEPGHFALLLGFLLLFLTPVGCTGCIFLNFCISLECFQD